MDNINQEAVWYNLLGIYPELGKKFCNTLRNDKSPGCSFSLWNGRWKLNDWASSAYHHSDCIKAYALYHNIDIKEAYKQIVTNSLLTVKEPQIIEKPAQIKKIITPIKRNWYESARKFWADLGVTELTNIECCKGFIVNTGSEIYTVDKSNELGFIYWFKDKTEYKLYFPYATNKRFKFLSGVKAKTCWFLNNSTEILFIAKSSKDYKVYESLFKELDIKISLCHVQSERISDKLSYIPNFKHYQSYKKVYCNLDSDETGITASNNLNTLIGIEPLFTPEPYKDISEFYLGTDRETVKQWLCEQLKL
jgi:hypothetical protein